MCCCWQTSKSPEDVLFYIYRLLLEIVLPDFVAINFHRGMSSELASRLPIQHLSRYRTLLLTSSRLIIHTLPAVQINAVLVCLSTLASLIPSPDLTQGVL